MVKLKQDDYSNTTFGKDPPLSQCPEPVAIVGMGCRWPGGVTTPSQLWDMLKNKRSGFDEFEKNKLNIEGFYHPDQQRPGSMYTRGGYFLSEDPKEFDHSFFGITPLETTTMDPTQRKLLEVVYEAFENAGETWETFSGSRTGVFAGSFNYDHELMQIRDSDHLQPYATTGGGITIISNRINYVFNLKGPSVTLDTACSSSMYALHMAVTALRCGDCDSAIVVGSNLILGPEGQLLTTKLGAVSPTSICHTFDVSADGYARAEGIGALYLKKVPDAITCGNPLRAIIRGTAMNANGRTGGISHPSPEGQEAVIRQAYKSAGGLDLDLTGYFECHGTGTPVGDPLEVRAIGKVFAPSRTEDRLLIGSIKTNLGHSESASGIAGIMKAVLAIENGLIPPTIGIVNPNPAIDFDGARVSVVTDMTSWPSKPIRRASVNSFGYGGANAHCIIDHPDSIIPGYRLSGRKLGSSLLSGITREVNRQQDLLRLKSLEGKNNGSLDAVEEISLKKILNGTSTSQADTEVYTNGNANGHTNGHTNGNGTNGINGEALTRQSNGGGNNPSAPSNDLANGHSNGSSKSHSNGHSNGIAKERPLKNLPNQTDTCEMLLEMENAPSRRLVLLPVSGQSESSLKANLRSTATAVNDFVLADAAYTLTSRRSLFSHRAFTIADTTSQKVSIDESSFTTGKSSGSYLKRIGFIFTGQGAQWPQMGQELMDEYEVFRSSIRYQDFVLTQLSTPPHWTIEELLKDPIVAHRIHEPQFSQTVCTALQLALVALLKSWGIQPVAAVGHSSGEIAAAHAAGYQTAAESIVLAYLRGQAVARNKQKGSMLAVGLGVKDVEPYLRGIEETVKVAAVNSPESTTLSGDIEAVSSLQKSLEAEGIFARLLKTSGNAYHSHHMAALGMGYEDTAQVALSEISKIVDQEQSSLSTIEWHSSVTPFKTPNRERITASYWRKNLESPVLFSDAVQQMVKNEANPLDLLLEIGPHPALSGPLKQIRVALQQTSHSMPAYLGTIVRGKDALASMLSLAGNMFLLNASINLTAVNAVDEIHEGQKRLVHGSLCIDWPNYSYHYGPILYHENRWNREWRLRKHLRHDLLGARQPGVAGTRPSWRNMLRLKDVPWLEDHKLLPHPIFPAAGYLSMAIEAVTQLHLESDKALPAAGFSLRSVSINSTLQIPDNEIGVEVILNMHPLSLTTTKTSSKWYEFSISSESAETGTWSVNCSGRISVETEEKESKPIFVANPKFKALQADRWYEKFAEVGLGYGPTFQGISSLHAFAEKNQAMANLALRPTTGLMKSESTYSMHPATLDTALQLALISFHGGHVEKAKHAFVPIGISEMSIWTPKGSDDTLGLGFAAGNIRGLRDAFGDTQIFTQSGKVLLDMRQLRCVSYEGSMRGDLLASPVTRNPFMRLVWKPCIDALSKDRAAEIFPPQTSTGNIVSILEKLDRLTTYILLSISQAHYKINEDKTTDHLQLFLSWVDRCVKPVNNNSLSITKEALEATTEQRSQFIAQLFDETHEIAEARLVRKVYENLPSILDGRKTGSEVLLEDSLLANVYLSGIFVLAAYTQLQRVIDLVAHKAPRMKILEIGVGFGGATRAALKTLEGDEGCKRYHTYTLTDISTSFLDSAKTELANHHGLLFKQLDIERDPIEQGFEADFDLVIASQVLHTTKDAMRSLQHARKLLRPGGKLVLLELTRAPLCSGLVLGTLPGYWNARSDNGEEPLKSKEQWSELCSQSGFSGADAVLDDYQGPEAMASVTLTTAMAPVEHSSSEATETFILHEGSIPHFANQLKEELQSRNRPSICVPLSEIQAVPNGSRVISVIDLSAKTINQYDVAEFELMKSLLHRAASLTWVSVGGMIRGSNPEASIMVGILRTLAKEASSVKFMSVDIGSKYEDCSIDLARTVVHKEASLHTPGNHLAWDTEFAFHDGSAHVSRLVPDREMNDEYDIRERSNSEMAMAPLSKQPPLTVRYEQPGLLSSLYFDEDPGFATPLGDDCVEIETAAMGLNVKDLAVATGRFAWHKFSTECAGTISKVGNGVEGLQIGDRVYGAVPGNFGNYVRSPAMSLQKMSPRDRFDEVASLPVAYMTAVYAFKHLARLSKGESVLIQSATGGLGLAALRIAKHLEADIFATVGTEDKVNVLVEEFGIPRARIFNSREVSATTKIMEATGGKGLDVILCSAAGDMMHEMWRCIAPLGRFIEVGRTDVIDRGTLSLEIFQRNATFSSFDLGLMNQQKPEVVAKLMQEVGDLFRSGIVKPIDHIRTFSIAELEQAMLQFSKGTHLGKIVVTFDDPNAMLKVAPITRKVRFDKDATFLLVGCLGGLGRSISTWMAEHGARHLTYLSRSGAAGSDAKHMLEYLNGKGVSTEVIQCDITIKSQVEVAVKQASEKHEIRGVLNAAAVFEDVTFEKTTHAQMHRVLSPKVVGTLNLHSATLQCPLSFFTMTSSAIALVATVTQASYCAANAFQDAFARYRTSQNLPVQSLAFGLILGAGVASERLDLQRSLNRNGLYGTHEVEFHKLLESSFLSQNSKLVHTHDPYASAHLLTGLEPSRILDLDKKSLGADFPWYNDVRFATIVQAMQDLSQEPVSASTNASIRDQVSSAPESKRKNLLVEAVVQRLAKLLFLVADEIDPKKSVSSYGMDSMIATELRNWIVKSFGVDMSFLEILNSDTRVEAIAEKILGGFKG